MLTDSSDSGFRIVVDSLFLDTGTRFGRLRLAGPSSNLSMMDWNESLSLSITQRAACARCVHREIKENLETANVSRPN